MTESNSSMFGCFPAVIVALLFGFFAVFGIQKSTVSSIAAEQAQATLRANGTFKKHPSVLFIRQMTGGQVNPANGSFMFGTAFVDELTDKSITARKPVSFSGSVLAALTSISFAAGDVDTTDFGYCGKSSQTAHVTSGGNALVFLEPNSEVTVA